MTTPRNFQANEMRRQALSAMAGKLGLRPCTVQSYNPSIYAVKVQIQPVDLDNPDQSLSDWLPILALAVGNAFGIQIGPNVGDAGYICTIEGDQSSYGYLGAVFNNVEQPISVPSGEFWVTHASTSQLKFTNDGDVTLTTAKDLIANVGNNLTATITNNASATVGGNLSAAITGTATLSAAQWNIKGPWAWDGDGIITGKLTVTGDVVAAGISLDNHVHGGVQSGGSVTTGPIG